VYGCRSTPETVALHPFYRRKGEGQKGDTNICYSAMVLGGLFPCRCLPGGIEGRRVVVKRASAACAGSTVHSEYLVLLRVLP
jgi:hypothetical protein